MIKKHNFFKSSFIINNKINNKKLGIKIKKLKKNIYYYLSENFCCKNKIKCFEINLKKKRKYLFSKKQNLIKSLNECY